MSIEAMGTRLVIKRVETEKKTSSGIVLQYDHTQSPRAEVVSKGNKVDINVDTGDNIIPDWNRVAHTKHENQDFFIIDQADILGRYI
jgi:co-chaperonin GroES (HSP10)